MVNNYLNVSISIIIPVFNASEKIGTIINCINGQSVFDYEVMLIDDGSTDNSLDICQECAIENERIKVFHQENAGVSSARNLGLSKAQGEFITFLDADDEIPSNYLEKLLKTAIDNKADISVCDVTVINNNQETKRFTCPEKKLTKTQALNHVLSREAINSGPCAKLFRRSVIGKSIFPRLKAYEDIIFVVDVFDKAQNIVSTNETEYKYIQNQDGAMSSFLSMPSEDIIVASEYLIGFIECHPNLSPKCFYTTVSHLMQYCQSINDKSSSFTKKAKRLIKNNNQKIICSPAFSWKEKMYYLFY